MNFYIVTTDVDDIITISNPRLNMIGEARIIDESKIHDFADIHLTYYFKENPLLFKIALFTLSFKVP